jgi:spermidine/putrescine transport system permease protein
MTRSAAAPTPTAARDFSPWERVRGWVLNPWGRPRFLAVITWGYMIWAIVPVLIAIQFSFNGSRSRTTWHGFSTRWYYSDPVDSVWNNQALRDALAQSLKLAVTDVVIATPIGVLLAIGLARWRGHGSAPSNFLMLFPLVTPEIVMGVSLLLLFTRLEPFMNIGTGTTAQILGHVTFSISYVVVIVRGRLFQIGRIYEEAAADLGASPATALTRVLLPLLTPAIIASAAIVFAVSLDDFVISQWLSSGSGTDTVPVKIYSATRAAPLPSTNAIATVMVFLTLTSVIAGYLVYRAFTRGERGARSSGIAEAAAFSAE